MNGSHSDSFLFFSQSLDCELYYRLKDACLQKFWTVVNSLAGSTFASRPGFFIRYYIPGLYFQHKSRRQLKININSNISFIFPVLGPGGDLQCAAYINTVISIQVSLTSRGLDIFSSAKTFKVRN